MVTNPKIVFLIVISLASYALAGLFATVFLIVHKADAALIAVVAGQAGTALGGLLSTLNNTRTQAQPAENLPNGGSSTIQTSTTTTTSPAVLPSTEPTPVIVKNDPAKSDETIPVETKP